MPRPVIAVVYDFGSVAPADIVDRLEPLGDVVLAVCRSAHTEQLALLLADLAPVVLLDGDHGPDLDAAAARLREHRPDAVLTYSERRLGTTAALAARLGLPYHDADTVRLLTDKYEQRRRLRERGVDPVRGRLLRTPADWAPALAAVGLPAVLKPVRGEGSRSTHLVRDAATGAALAARLLTAPAAEGGEDALVLEEYLAGVGGGPFGDHVSVESAVVDGRVTHWAVTGKFPLAPPFREVGHFWPAPVTGAERAAVLDLAAHAVHALGVRTGITHTEVKLTADGPRLIEVNGRLGGFQSGLGRLAGGLDPVVVAARLALGGAAPETWVPDDRVVYARALPTPAEGGLLTGVHGVAEALALPGVDTYETRVQPGATVNPGVSTGELAVLWGTADDHAAMLAVLDRALDTLTYIFADATDATGAAGRREVRARDLESAPTPEGGFIPRPLDLDAAPATEGRCTPRRPLDLEAAPTPEARLTPRPSDLDAAAPPKDRLTPRPLNERKAPR